MSDKKSNNQKYEDRDDVRRGDCQDDKDDEHNSGRTIIGTNGSDILTGTTGGDNISGGNGNDRISGGAGNDYLDGGAGDDTIDGGTGNDRISGGSGKDTFIGGAGNDNIDGGSGLDVSVYSGNFRDYKLTLSRDGGHCGEDDDDHSAMTVHDLRSGVPDGVDVLKNVEILRFADGEYEDGHFFPQNTSTPATIGNPTAMSVTEDVGVSGANLVATGIIPISDPNAGQASFQTTVTGVGTNLGSLVLAASGAYTYSVANSAVQFLGAGVTKIDSFTIRSLDGTTKVVSFTITGTNDAAVIGDPSVAAVTEDAAVVGGNLRATGSISVSDVDTGQASFQTTVTGVGTNLGSLVLATNGAYTYSVANSVVQTLGAGVTRVDSFTITSLDGTAKAVSFTINGANDSAVIGAPTVASVTEDVAAVGGNLTATGSISVSDIDTGQASFQTTVTGAGTNLGTLVLAASGAYTYSVANSAVQFLGAGVTKIDSFTIRSLDGTTKVVSFTITGTNDAAVIGNPSVAAVTEDAAVVGGNLRATGSISVSDVDTGQASFQTTVTGVGTNLGSLVLATNGAYTYSVANSAVQFLGAGVTKIDSFTIRSLDGATKVVSFIITGTNDAAVIGDPSVAAVTEDAAVVGGNLRATGSISVSDVDTGQASFQNTVTGAGTNLGTLVLAANGTYTYLVANSAVQYLGAGDSKVESFSITSLDGTTQTVNFTIHGANDAAVIGGLTSNTVTEDVAVDAGQLKSMGTISVTDADAGQSGFQTSVVSAPGNLGTMVIVADGAYAYSVANSAVQYLGAGVVKVEQFTITSRDGTTQTASFNIHGANDPAAIGVPTVNSVTENVAVVAGQLSATGSISVADADAGQSSFQTSVPNIPSNLGTLVLASDGAYAYSVANSDVAFLGAGETRLDSFVIFSLDGTLQIVSFTIHGVGNDAAVIGTPPVPDVTEDAAVVAGQLTVAGFISISDVNPLEAFFNTSVIGAPGNLGTLGIAANGEYTYSVANGAVQYLGAGIDKVDNFTITSLDGTTQTASFTIHGVNGAANIGLPPVNTVTENVAVVAGQLTATGIISIADEDAGEASFQTAVSSAPGNLGTLELASNGAYTFSVSNSAIEYLDPGFAKAEDFVITSVDGTTRTVSFTINGASQAVIGTPTENAVTEDVSVNQAGNLTASGIIAISDADPGQANFQTSVISAPGNLGSLDLASNGIYTYSVNNSAVQYLGEGVTKVENFTITSLDGTTQTASFSIHGANEVPVVLDDRRTIQEDEAVVITLASATDLDIGDTLTIVSVSDVTFGTAELVDGVLTFRPTLNYSSIDNLGESLAPASFTYTVADQHGATCTATVTLDIVAVADAPVIPVPANLGFELENFNNWDFLGGVGLASRYGNPGDDAFYLPYDGESMARLDGTWVEQGDLERFLGIASGGLNGLASSVDYTGTYEDYQGVGYYNNVTDGSAIRTTLAVTAGQHVTFNWNFISGDEAPYGDFGFVVINGVAERLSGNSAVEDYGSTDWQTYSYTADYDGILSLGFGVVDTGDLDANSQLLIDNVRFNGSAADGFEDSAILLAVGSELADNDDSESLSLTTISGVPFGAVLSAGVNNNDGSWTLTSVDLQGLTILPPPDFFGTFTLTIAATSTEASNGDLAMTTKMFDVTVFPVSDGTGIDADSLVTVPADSPLVGLNIAEPIGVLGDVLITSVPTNGLVTIGGGSPVTAGAHVLTGELAALNFTPLGATGSNSGMSYTWTDASGTHTDTHSFTLVNATGAIRVAVVYSLENMVPNGLGGEMPLSLVAAADIYDQLNDDSYIDFSPALISVGATESAGDLLAVLSNYDVIVHSGSRADVMTAAYWSALRQYVENNEGGVVTAGSFARTLHETSLATNPDADFVTPITPAGYTTALGEDSTFTAAGGHDITYGIGVVPGSGINGTILEGALQIDTNAVSLAAHPAGGYVIAYKDLADTGRTVYLGEPYAESEVSGVHTEPVRTGFPDQLLEQAVAWAAKGQAETSSVSLSGDTGHDVLSGGADNDTLAGNGGNDQLTGGLGSDRFYYSNIDEGNDTITDFETGSGGDVLDIHDLLSGYNPVSSVIDDFVELVADGSGTQVNVDADGGGDSFASLVLLSNVPMSTTLLDELVLQGNMQLV